ncbi:MAG: hypothetical protein Q9164_002318 [Protoblastenia rupestris]
MAPFANDQKNLYSKVAVTELYSPPAIDYDLDSRHSVVASKECVSPSSNPEPEHNVAVEQSLPQKYLWSWVKVQPALPWYTIPYVIRLRGPLQLDALDIALCFLQRCQKSLRTTFRTIDGVDVQIVHDFREKKLKLIDMSAYNEDHLHHALQLEQTAPFNLETGPGWRVSVYRRGSRDHVLCINMHRMISDTSSLDVLHKELARLYSAAISGQNTLFHFDRLPIRHCDYIVPQEKHDQAECERQLEYWATQLEASRPAELFHDKPRPAVLLGWTDTQHIALGGNLFNHMRQFYIEQQVSPLVVLLAAFKAAHYRLTGASDTVIGTVNDNRSQGERDVIGLFDSIHCIRIKLDEEESFQELVHRVHTITTEINDLTKQHVRFEQVVKKLQIETVLSCHPLAQILLVVYPEQDRNRGRFEGIQTESLNLPKSTPFDIELHFYHTDKGFQGEIVFSTELYKPETISNMLEVFRIVLEQGLAEPGTAVSSLNLSKGQDVPSGKVSSQIQITEYPRSSSVVDIFREQAAATPHRVAVKDASTLLTYAQLCEQSDVLAQWLARQSIASESLVGVFAHRSCETIVAFMGILKANLAYLPFDNTTPAGRMETILSSIQGHNIILVGSGVRLPKIKGDREFVLITDILDNHDKDIINSPKPKVWAAPSATSLAYVMFTSGSTGQPKGVMVEHRGIVRLVKGCNMAGYLPNPTTMAHLTSIAFDNSTWEIYAALLNGGTLICIDATKVLDCSALGRIFAQERILSAMITPALLKQHLMGHPDTIAQLDMLCVQGERANTEDMFLALKLTEGTIINAYGPTENSVTSTFFALSDSECCTNGVPIGSPISNSGAHVMDVNQRLVPPGVIGELVVTGDGLARGYTDPERNMNRFITVEINGEQTKAYRTGDYARHRPTDGQLEFIGRIDGQVKIRGNRVELQEIEHVLRSHDCVADAVAVLQNENQDVRLSSYVTVRDIRPGSIEESQLVETWLDYWNVETYTPIGNILLDDIGRDFIGWTSTHDGSEINRAEMNEWLDETIATILDGGDAGHILEIGTGSGMILFNLNKGLKSYVGLEPSERAVNFVTKASELIPAFAGKVSMHKASAGDTGHQELAVTPDTAILNSVIQYFPSQHYLLRIIQSLITLGVKKLFIGDIRSHALHEEFLADRALFIAGNTNISKAEFRRIMADIRKAESELLIDPVFFTGLSNRLSSISHVEILPKRVHANNELSRYRYAAVLHINRQIQQQGEPIREINQESWIDFTAEGLKRESLRDRLQGSMASSVVAIRNIPNSKTILQRTILDSLDIDDEVDYSKTSRHWMTTVREKLQHRPSLSAVDLVLLAQQTHWRVELSWAQQHSQRGALDAIFYRYPCSVSGETRVKFRFLTDDMSRPYDSLSSQPLRRQLRQRVRDQLHHILRHKLPPYMVPKQVTFLDKMPVNQNGKVDRQVLALSGQSQGRKQGQVQQPTSNGETRMCKLWSEVLSIDPTVIGRQDNFFSLGGDSIAAMRLISEARKLGIKIVVADVFRYPKLDDLASQSGHIGDEPSEEIAPFALLGDAFPVTSFRKDISSRHHLEPATIQDAYPCTPLQEGLIFLTSKRPGDYMRQAVIELSPHISETNLRRAWESVARTMAILRTRIVQHDDFGLLQVVVDEPIRWTDSPTKELDVYLAADKEQSMDLGQPLSRYAFLKDEAGLPKWFVWTAHHALYDGWSLHLIVDALYKSYQDKSIRIEPGPQFQTFIKYVRDQDNEKTTRYWQDILAESKFVSFPSLPPSLGQPVADTSIKHHLPNPPTGYGGITTSSLARAAWALVMASMTNSDDVVFGMTVYGRNAPNSGLDKMVAPTIATVPVRVQIDSKQTCSEYLTAVQRAATEMIPFEQTGLQNIAKTSSAGQQACKFQTQLVIQPQDPSSRHCPFGQWQDGSEEQGFTTYALTVELWLSPDKITAIAMSDSRAIQPWLVRKMLQRFHLVIHQLAHASPVQALSEIEMMTPGDLEQIWQWNSSVPAQIDRCVHSIIEETARANPTATAVCAWDGELTYEHLDELATRLANELLDRGVALDSVVPLCFQKSMWTVVAIIGVLKAGGGFVLLDSSFPEKRLRAIVQQVKGSLILSCTLNRDLASRLVQEAIALDWQFFTNLGHRARPHRQHEMPSTSSTCYVIFTSGSTGTPKGVMISHSNIASALHYQTGVMGLKSESRLFDFTSYSFDVAISNIFTVLAAGGCLCIPSDEDRKNNMERSIVSLRANTLDLTPSVARLLSPSRLPQVRSLTLGGEPLRPTDIEQWWGKVRIYNAYGPSECTPTSTVNHSAPSPEYASQIGRGVGLVTWVVNPDCHNKLLPPGCTGELLLEGPLVGRGYLDNAEMTATSFIEDPVWLLRGSPGKPGRHGRFYKTGDLVRYNEHGTLTFVCRKDCQVKIRGQRVELGEIEHALRSEAYVDDAVAVLQHDDRQQPWIAGFVAVHNLNTIQDQQHDDQGEAQQRIESWKHQFDGDIYSSIDTIQSKTIGRDFMGWTSMYDGIKIDHEEMNEWLNDTIKTILSGAESVGRVLEIGSGSGMILFNLADKLQDYIGLEPSERAVNFIAKTVESIPTLKDKVKIFNATAADISRLALDAPLSPNLVVLNSVIQYFPDQEYLLKVIKDLIQLESVETIFFGDVRSYALHKEILALRALHINNHASQDELRHMLTNLERAEPELLVDPGFFTGLASRLPGRIKHVEVLPKIMHATNELSCYRYAAVVHLNSRHQSQHIQKVKEISPDTWVDFAGKGLNRHSLLNLLNNTFAAAIAISNIPNRNNVFARDLVSSLENRGNIAQHQSNWVLALRENVKYCYSMSAIDLVELAQQAGFQVQISWARQYSQHGGIDAIFHRIKPNNGSNRTLFSFPTDHHDRAFHLLSNQPLRQQMEVKVRDRLLQNLKAHLPSYMVPQVITILDRMPISSSGKIDRRMLAESVQTQTVIRETKRRQPTATEKEMQKIWSQVLNIEPDSIGLDDGFIQLGGSSLDAMKVVTVARQSGFELAVADMFRHPTMSIHHLLQPRSGERTDGRNSPLTLSSANLMAEIARHDARIASVQAIGTSSSLVADNALQPEPKELLTVLLTGANGFIGTQVLRQLLEHSRVNRVITVVRGESADMARQRTIDAARRAQWWTEFHEEMLEVWPGDLSLPHLGLDPAKWRLVEDGNTIDLIIHNGASVHFMKSYAALEAVNVGSTAEMLRLVSSTPRTKFVYVSTARHQDPTEEQEEDVANKLTANSNGYGQTKFAAETLVKRAASRSPARSNHFAVVSPGLVIGTPTEGVVNADDWIWRLAAACIRVGVYNADSSDKWIPLSDAAATAKIIIDTALDPSPRPTTQVKGGITMSDFWATLARTGYQLKAKSAAECVAAIRKDMESSQETHPLWALADMLESLEETVKSIWATSWRENGISPIRLRVALRKSAEFLNNVGFLPLPVVDAGSTAAEAPKTAMGPFSRSGA